MFTNIPIRRSDATVLERELATFARLLPNLLSQAEGRWVLIKDDRLLGIFVSQGEAVVAGYRQLGAIAAFLTREIRDVEPIHVFNRDFYISALGID